MMVSKLMSSPAINLVLRMALCRPAGTKPCLGDFQGMTAKARLNQELDRLQPHLPGWGVRWLRRIRGRAATMVRIPAGIVLILAGFVGFLPILGFWMVPLGLALLALDVPFLRGPLARVLAWINAKLEARAAPRGVPAAKPSPRPPANGRSQ
jgi:hypothetical protein